MKSYPKLFRRMISRLLSFFKRNQPHKAVWRKHHECFFCHPLARLVAVREEPYRAIFRDEIPQEIGLRFRARRPHERHHVRDPGLGKPPDGSKALDDHEAGQVLYPKPAASTGVR